MIKDSFRVPPRPAPAIPAPWLPPEIRVATHRSGLASVVVDPGHHREVAAAEVVVRLPGHRAGANRATLDAIRDLMSRRVHHLMRRAPRLRAGGITVGLGHDHVRMGVQAPAGNLDDTLRVVLEALQLVPGAGTAEAAELGWRPIGARREGDALTEAMREAGLLPTAIPDRGAGPDAALADAFAAGSAPDEVTVVASVPVSTALLDSIESPVERMRPCAPSIVNPAGGQAPPVPRFHYAERSGTGQVSVGVAGPREALSDADWSAAVLVTHALGGSNSARLDQVLRDRLGYSFGMRARISWSAAGAQLTIRGNVREEVAADAVRALRELLAAAATSGLHPAEAERARGYLLGSSARQLSTGAALVRTVATDIARREPPGAAFRRQRTVAAVTADQIGVAARRHFGPAELSLTAVGEPGRADEIRQAWK